MSSGRQSTGDPLPDLILKKSLECSQSAAQSGAFDISYLPELERRRLNALDEDEQLDYKRLVSLLLQKNDNNDKNLQRLGELTEKADSYHVEEIDENVEQLIKIDGKQFQNVWNEASKMRESGYFIEIADKIKCPIRIIHGDKDTTPIEGVIDPIKDHIKDIKWYEIGKCGHYPWKEKYGKDRFFEIIKEESGL